MSIKKILSLVLAIVMVLSMIPAVSAAEVEAETEVKAEAPVLVADEAPETETEDPSIEWIEIANEEQWNEWFGNYSSSKLLAEKADGNPVYFKLTESFEITALKLHYIGYTNSKDSSKSKTCVVTIDLDGNTLTYNKAAGATAATRFMGTYGTADTTLTFKNGTLINNGEYDGATGGVFFNSKGTLNLENLTITDNSNNTYTSSGKLVGGATRINLTNCTFNINSANCTGTGAAVAFTGGTCTAKGCTFNVVGDGGNVVSKGGLLAVTKGNVTIEGCTFNGGEAAMGGSVYVSGGNVTMTDCVFNGGKAEYGSQVYVDTVLDTKGNVTSFGTLTMNNCQLSGGEAPFGAIAVVGKGVLTMNGGTVANAVAKNYTTTDAEGKETTVKCKGGNFYVYNEQSLKTAPVITLNEVTIKDGSSQNIGGNFYASSKNTYAGPKVTMTDCTISGGQGANGANIGITGATNLTINGGTISGGKGNNGVGVWAWNDTSRSVRGILTLDGVTISGNEGQSGGALYVHNDKDRAPWQATANNCTFTDCTATKNGGAVYMYNAVSEELTLTLENCEISNCTAANGGAIALEGAGVMELKGGVIENCKASGNGGAIYGYNSIKYTATETKDDTTGEVTKVTETGNIAHHLTIDGTVIKNNEAAKHAGGLYFSNVSTGLAGTLTVANATFDGNESTNERAEDSTDEDSYFGGNMYLAGTAKKDYYGVEHKTQATFTNTIIKNGVADGFGGNMGIAGSAQVTMTGCTVADGKVMGTVFPEKCGGGNLYMGNAKATLTLNDTDLMGGESALYGGNIRVGGGVIYIDQGSTIVGGIAAQAGQTIHLNSSNTTRVYLYDGEIKATAVAAPADEAEGGEEIETIPCEAVKVYSAGTLKLINGTASGFDAEAYTVYGKSYAVANEDGTYTIKHYAVDGATTKTGSCEEAGTVTIECAECARTFVYEEAAAGHAIVIDKAVAATCTEAGLTEGQHCALCDYAVAQEVIPAA
ncbi:MAG: hypothetical protein IKU07_00215, partial [Oscillospiraceae bacterium]|nr:hypothetical protein [Oscillospiraceae bacterium]